MLWLVFSQITAPLSVQEPTGLVAKHTAGQDEGIRKRGRHGSRQKEVTLVTTEVKSKLKGGEVAEIERETSGIECVKDLASDREGEGRDGKERRGDSMEGKGSKRLVL